MLATPRGGTIVKCVWLLSCEYRLSVVCTGSVYAL